jgi:hypothetical protein
MCAEQAGEQQTELGRLSWFRDTSCLPILPIIESDACEESTHQMSSMSRLRSTRGKTNMPISTSDRCADCGKIDKLVKCSKEACRNKICPTCVDRYSGKHCNSCYISVGSMMAAEWVFSGENPPNTIRIDR